MTISCVHLVNLILTCKVGAPLDVGLRLGCNVGILEGIIEGGDDGADDELGAIEG